MAAMFELLSVQSCMLVLVNIYRDTTLWQASKYSQESQQKSSLTGSNILFPSQFEPQILIFEPLLGLL